MYAGQNLAGEGKCKIFFEGKWVADPLGDFQNNVKEQNLIKTSGFRHFDGDMLHSAPQGEKRTKRGVVRPGLYMLTNQLPRRKKAKPWLVKLVDSCGVNTPKVNDSRLPDQIPWSSRTY